MSKRERNQRIAEAYLRGDKIEAIGCEWGITRQRVEQIARENGCPLRRFQGNHNSARSVLSAEMKATIASLPAPVQSIIHDLGERLWCDQCERHVRTWQAKLCKSRFCAAKEVAA